MNSSIIKKKLEEYFNLEKKTNKEIFNQISLFVYYIESQKSNSDLFILAKLLNHSELIKLISYYDGDVVKVPSKDELKYSDILVACYYLREIKNWSWNEVKKFIPVREEDELFSPIALGRKINKIKENMNNEIMNLINSLDITNIEDLINDVNTGKRYE